MKNPKILIPVLVLILIVFIIIGKNWDSIKVRFIKYPPQPIPASNNSTVAKSSGNTSLSKEDKISRLASMGIIKDPANKNQLLTSWCQKWVQCSSEDSKCSEYWIKCVSNK